MTPHTMRFDELVDPIRATPDFLRLDATTVDGILSSLGGNFEACDDPFDRHRTISAQIGAAPPGDLRRILAQLRTDLEEKMFRAATEEIQEAFVRSPEEGWTVWLTKLAAAVSAFHRRHSLRLCDTALPFDSSKRKAMADFRGAAECMLQSRWDEAYEQIEWLAQQESLPLVSRAKLITILGQIDLFWLEKPTRARARLEEAKALAPEDGLVFASLGDFFLRESDFKQAADHYRRAIDLAPRIPNGYTGMGDQVQADQRLDEQERSEQAEDWYRKTILEAGGDSLGYTKLFQLLGRPQSLATNEQAFLVLAQTTIDVDPENEYQTCLDVGDCYLGAKRFAEAREWYDKAVALQSNCPRAYTFLAQWRRAQTDDKADEEAEAFCQKAMAVAPECPSGHLTLAGIYEEKGEWDKARRIYAEFPGRTRPLGRFARASVGRMEAKLEKYDEAERLLLEELRSDPEEGPASRALEELASDYYRKQKDEAAARRIYGELLQALGEPYRGSYHNWLGNMHYSSGHHQLAVAEYEQAIDASPLNVVYRRNLGNAYEYLGDYESACRALESAFGIDKDENALGQIARLKNLQANKAYERGNYQKAIVGYNAAIDLVPTEAVYHVNLASAWKQIKELGKREHALEQAIQAYQAARKVSDKQEYAEQIERLQRRREIAQIYGERPLDYINVVTPISVEVAADLVRYVEGATAGTLSEELLTNVNAMREKVTEQLGARLPGIRFRGNEGDLPGGTYIVLINEIPRIMGKVSPGRLFCPGAAATLARLKVEGEPAADPISGEPGLWIDSKDRSVVEGEGLAVWELIEFMMRHVDALVRKNIVEFLGHQEIVNLLESETSDPTQAIRASSEKLTALTTVCKALAAGEVPIRPFPELCTTFDDQYGKALTLPDIVERIRLLPSFRELLPGNDGLHSFLSLTPRFEDEFRRSIYQDGGHSILAMEPARCQETLSAVREAVQVQGKSQSLALVIQDAPLRPLLRKLIELEFPGLHVLSAAECVPKTDSTPSGSIDLESNPPVEPLEFGNQRRFRKIAERFNKDVGVDPFRPLGVSVEAFVAEGFSTQASATDDKPIEEMFALMRDGLFYELGIILPEVKRHVDRSLSPTELKLQLNGGKRDLVLGLEADEFLVNDTVDRLGLLGIEGQKAVDPATGSECAKVRNTQGEAETCRKAGLTTWGPQGYLVLQLSSKIRAAAAQFQTDLATRYMLDSLGEAHPELVRIALERYSLSQISCLLRELLAEEVSIRDLRSILESLLSINGRTDVDMGRFIVFFADADRLCPAPAGQTVKELLPVQLADFVRTSLQRYISHKHTRGGSSLIVYLLDPSIEQRLGDLDARPLSADEEEKLRAAVRAEVGTVPSTTALPVVLTSFEARRPLRKIIEHEFPRLAVLNFQELSPEMNIQPISRISCE